MGKELIRHSKNLANLHLDLYNYKGQLVTGSECSGFELLAL